MNYEDLIEKQVIVENEFGKTVHVSLVNDPTQEFTLRIFTASPNGSEVAQKEFNITRDVSSSFVPLAKDIFSTPSGLAVLYERTRGVPLDQYIRSKPFDLSERLNIAISIAQGIEKIHKANFVYMGLSPRSVFVSPDGTVSLMDFSLSIPIGSSSSMPHFHINRINPEFVSPEQTGRINRDVDYRSDFYSFGVLLYYLFTGIKPFEGTRGELFHYHISKSPEPIHTVKEDIPMILSKVLARLMSKEPTERYQSSFGLIWDLNAIKEGLAGGHLQDFNLATKDIAQSFYVPQTLVGRKRN